ncbi:CAP domain-containing protein [Polaromonas eurypsychrophila]|uniref:CAP domain-containing protein n=1 Tax=Polaromonas eurypsychrophila TaxID=1614635 RepID=UPI00166488CD|nr:CAP domain-containing protein [Polaromonas eurypsychrophila]
MLAISTQLYAQSPEPEPEHPTLLSAVNAIRQQGCGESPAQTPALRENAVLSRVAALLADGSKLNDALKIANYRAVHATQINLRTRIGSAALTPNTLGKSCAMVLRPRLTEAGFHQRSNHLWVVVAQPFVAPAAAQGVQVEARILALVNAARAQPRHCGKDLFVAVPPLLHQSLLTEVAAGHAADMAQHSYFNHTARDGSTVDVRVTRAGYRWRSIGENLAAGQATPELAVQSWLNSPGHCANIMSPAFVEMGSAFVVNTKSKSGIYWVQVLGAGR